MRNITSMEDMAKPTPTKNNLSSKQLLIVCSLGVFFWLVFALVIRFSNGMGIFGGTIGAVTFLLSIPIAWLLILGIKVMARLSTGQIMSGLGISSATAGLCDGIALTWMPSLYGNESSEVLLGAAYIIWGVGIILILAYVMDTFAPDRLKDSN
jgi:hypothetical protein